MYTFTIVCMYSLHPCSCNHSMLSVHTITNIFASSTTTDRLMFHELFLRIVSMQVFRRILIIICTYWCSLYCRCVKKCSTHVLIYFHNCLHVFTACMFMYSLHVLSPYKYQYICIVYDNRSTDVPWIVSTNCFHASIQAHTPHHVRILLHTILSLFLFKKIVVPICVYTFTIACMLVHVFTPCFQCIQSPISLHRLRQPIDWCSINCSHASIHAHTPHHVHKSLYTIMFFFYDKLVVHMCIYTFTIACMYSLHACSCIHCMFSVHACSCFTPCFQCIQSPI